MEHTQPSGNHRPTLIVKQQQTRHGDGTMPPGKRALPCARENAYGALIIDGLSLNVQSFHVRQFLEEILMEPDLRQVLATPVRADGENVRLLVEVVQPIAEDAQRDAQDLTKDSDAAYVATLLHGIDYFIFPALCGKYNTPDALKTIVWPAFQRLERDAPKAAAVIKLCMRWEKFDEAVVFSVWLEARMLYAMQVLKLASF